MSPRKALSAEGVVFFLQGKVSFVPTAWITHACSEALEVEFVVAHHTGAATSATWRTNLGGLFLRIWDDAGNRDASTACA